MKYDSSMKECHSDILKALRAMCSDDTKINENFSPNDGSPAPLRDYIKQKHGKPYHGFGSSELYVDCHPTKGITIESASIVEMLGEKLEMSWSQVTNFIRNNWDDIFRKESSENQPSPAAEDPAKADEPPENQSSYIDKLREQYPKVNETDEWFYDSGYCPSDFFEELVEDPFEKECITTTKHSPPPHDLCQKCWRSPCPANMTLTKPLRGFEKDYYSHYPAEETATEKNGDEPPKKMSKMCQELFASNADTDTKTANLPNPPVPANAEEIASTFNYAVLSAEMGDYLKHKEQQLKNEYMNFTANCGAIFAEAQEKLSREKDGNGMFLKWIDSMGFKKSTVYNMISINKFLVSNNWKLEQREVFEKLPKLLQYEVSKPSAPPELVEQVKNGDIKSHSEYIKLKKELERTQEECHRIDANSAAKDKEYQKQLDEANKRAEEAESQARTYQHNYFQANKNFDMMCEDNVKLEERIKELEARPIEVAVQQDEKALAEKEAEIQRLKNELEELSQQQSCSLDDCFEKPGDISAGEILEFYETLHTNAISAIKECARFIKNKIPNSLQRDAKSRFNMLEELLADCKEEMEE